MLLQISSAAAASLAEELVQGSQQDAVALLLGCHQRIRHFTRMAVELSRGAAPAEQVGAAARSVQRYYTQALPLHEADENDSVYPRLRAAAPPAELAAANQAMVDQHRGLNALIADLVPQWEAIALDPAQAPASGPGAQALQVAWHEHLGLEERVIFPSLRARLSPDDLAAIRQEMAERRTLRPGGSHRPVER